MTIKSFDRAMVEPWHGRLVTLEVTMAKRYGNVKKLILKARDQALKAKLGSATRWSVGSRDGALVEGHIACKSSTLPARRVPIRVSRSGQPVYA